MGEQILFSLYTNLRFWFVPVDQVEHAHDNPLDEITLGECDLTASTEVTVPSSDKLTAPKTLNLEVDRELMVRSEVEDDAQVEGKKTKKKDVKKEKAKGKEHFHILVDLFNVTCLFYISEYMCK